MLQAHALHGLRPDLVVGSSVGALNAAVLAEHEDLGTAAEVLDEVWCSLRTAQLLHGSRAAPALRLAHSNTVSPRPRNTWARAPLWRAEPPRSACPPRGGASWNSSTRAFRVPWRCGTSSATPCRSASRTSRTCSVRKPSSSEAVGAAMTTSCGRGCGRDVALAPAARRTALRLRLTDRVPPPAPTISVETGASEGWYEFADVAVRSTVGLCAAGSEASYGRERVRRRPVLPRTSARSKRTRL